MSTIPSLCPLRLVLLLLALCALAVVSVRGVSVRGVGDGERTSSHAGAVVGRTVADDASSSCAAHAAEVFSLRALFCSSLATQPSVYCGTLYRNVTHAGKRDFPSQAAYFVHMLSALAVTPTPCARLSRSSRSLSSSSSSSSSSVLSVSSSLPDVAATLAWLNEYNALPSRDVQGWPWQWLVFQVGYFDQPRHPGERIESAFTLGMKCWAMAFLAQRVPIDALVARAADANVSLAPFVDAVALGTNLTLTLCRRVQANCFVNSTYDPARHNNTCPLQWDLMYAGFEKENALWGALSIVWPFYNNKHWLLR